MHQMPEYKDTVSLIPYGLPQFLDFELPPEKARKIKKTFVEQEVSLPDGGAQKDGESVQLCELMEDPEEGYLLNPDGRGEYLGEDYYTVQAEKHFGPWLGKWLPVPFFRHSGDVHDDGLPRFRSGPTNWARAYVTRVPSAADPEIFNWRVVLAFDMQVEEPQNGRHAALSPDDVTARAVCSLADRERDNSWFLTEGWVDGWLHSLWEDYFLDRAHRNERPRCIGEKENHLDYLASYLVYLQFLQAAIGHLNVRIVNLSGTQDKASDSQSTDTIDVDLILDIGNSRSTGILVENQPSKITDLNDSYRLQLRDLSHPENFYAEPFETRVEFSKADFGSMAFSKRSGRRSNAFTWVSPVRTGPEASRLAGLSSNAEGTSGMTSPKRYLWDQDKSSNLWYFNRANVTDREELVSSNSICRYLNNEGTPVSCVRELNPSGEAPAAKSYLANLFNATLPGCRNQDALPANQPRFSRSSMMMFLFMELIQQALVTINSPAQRYRRPYPDMPRRLRSIIFTVPPGMPFAEQRIYRRWAYAAVNILWEALGWKKIFYAEPPSGKGGRLRAADGGTRDFRMNPEIRCRWDEATCTQLVYLYNEINRNYQGDAHLFFESMGRLRTVPQEFAPAQTEVKPTLRVATIDIGGGTTDLSVTTYVLANDKSSTNRIWPKQEMRDGFNFGGDDVLKTVVSDIVCRAIMEGLVKRGVEKSAADMAIRDMFGKKSDNTRVQNNRIQFLRQVALPIAYEILAEYEKKDLHDVSGEINVSVRSLFRGKDGAGSGIGAAQPQQSVVDFFNETLQTRCGIAIDVMDMELNVRCSEVDKAVSGSVSAVLNGMGEVISAYDCDALLLTGRPSCWNAVVRQVFAMLPVAPDRVIPMHTYRVGPWYPFANNTGRITDPKTTVVTGAILCALAENSIEGFVFDSSRLELKSTAQYIGELDVQGSLSREKVWFPNLHPDKAKGEDKYTKVVEFSAPITIGFRQPEVPRWTATRCWRMEFADEEARHAAQGHTPYEVKVQFVIPEQDEGLDDIPETGRDIKAKLDEPQIDYSDPEAVQERRMNGGQMELVRVPGRPVRILLRTLGKKDEEGCWMDTGILF